MKPAPDPNVIAIPTTSQAQDMLYEHMKRLSIDIVTKEGYYRWSPSTHNDSIRNVSQRLVGEYMAAGYTAQMYGHGFWVQLP